MITNSASHYHEQNWNSHTSLASIAEPPTLLVVADDPLFHTLDAQVLSGEGYNVIQAKDAAGALRLAATTPVIHLLVTDFSMPGTNDLELARSFRVMHPRAAVLMVSDPPAGTQLEPIDMSRFALMAKPFACYELLRKVHHLLTEVSAPSTGAACSLK